MKKLILCGILALGLGVPGLSGPKPPPKATPAALTNLGQVTAKARQVLKRLQKDKESGKVAEAQVKSILDQIRSSPEPGKGLLEGQRKQQPDRSPGFRADQPIEHHQRVLLTCNL